MEMIIIIFFAYSSIFSMRGLPTYIINVVLVTLLPDIVWNGRVCFLSSIIRHLFLLWTPTLNIIEIVRCTLSSLKIDNNTHIPNRSHNLPYRVSEWSRSLTPMTTEFYVWVCKILKEGGQEGTKTNFKDQFKDPIR